MELVVTGAEVLVEELVLLRAATAWRFRWICHCFVRRFVDKKRLWMDFGSVMNVVVASR